MTFIILKHTRKEFLKLGEEGRREAQAESAGHVPRNTWWCINNIQIAAHLFLIELYDIVIRLEIEWFSDTEVC